MMQNEYNQLRASSKPKAEGEEKLMAQYQNIDEA